MRCAASTPVAPCADEAMLIAAGELSVDIRSNIPLRPELALPASATRHGRPQLAGLGHVVLDLGDDEFTLGRPHPMIDPSLRLELFAEQAADPEVPVVLLWMSCSGPARTPDPAHRWAPVIREAIAAAAASGRRLSVVVSLCGTDGDPQGRDSQAAQLTGAGAQVFASNAAAARAAAGVASALAGVAPGATAGIAAPLARGHRRARSRSAVSGDTGVPSDRSQPAAPRATGHRRRATASRSTQKAAAAADLLADPPSVITVGIDLLADALRAQAVDVTTVDFRPPDLPAADAPAALDALAAVLADPRLPAANALAAQRMLDTRALLVDVRPGREALGLHPGEFCHAGPPIEFDRASGPLRGALIGALIFEGLAADEPEAVAKSRGRRRGILATPATSGTRWVRWPG